MKLNTGISDGNRIFFKFPHPPLSYSLQCPVYLDKEVLDLYKINFMNLQALVRSFLLINNFAT
jgi:hypothetical protein